MFKNLVMATAISLILLPVTGHADAKAAKALVAKKAAIISGLHRKARKALVNAAQDGAFPEYFTAHDDGHRHEAKSRIERVSLKVQSKFHVEEMCLIDASGVELTRIVGKEIADDLSQDETGAVFFEPGFELRPRKSYVSPVYMSPDANRWVIAYVTPVLVADNNRAILHYEHGLDVYQNAIAKGVEKDSAIVVAVNDEGFVVSDTRKSIAIEMAGDNESPEAYFENFSFGGRDLDEVSAAIDAGTTLTDREGTEYNAAYKQVGRWRLIAFSKM